MIKFDDTKAIISPKGFNGMDGKQPQIAIIAMEDDHFERILAAHETTPVQNVFGNVLDSIRLMHIDGMDIFLSDGGSGGGASLAMEMEMMIAGGVNAIVMFGTAGALHKDTEIGTIILPTAATRDEGTSYHYIPDSDEIAQDPALLNIVRDELQKHSIEYLEGKTWTTDAIYRETVGKRDDMKRRGCLCVEMECASMLAVAQFRGIKFVQFLITIDNIEDDAPETDFALYQKKYNDELFDVALDAARRML